MGPEESMSTRKRETVRWFEWKPASHSAGNTLRLRGWKSSWGELSRRWVAVFGLGAVGGVACEVSARMGVGNLIGVDPGRYEQSSLATQPMSSGDIGKLKALVQGERAHAANPQVRVQTAAGLAQELPLRLLRRADVFVTAGDNLELLIWVGVLAVALGKPMLQGAVHGETWTAIVRAFDLRDADAACPACMLGRRDWANLHSRAGCDPASVPMPSDEQTRSLPTVCATAGQLVASEALKWLVARERDVLPSQEWTYCLQTHRVWQTVLPRSPTCRCPHQRWSLQDLDRGPDEVTPALLARHSGLPVEKLQVRAEIPWVRFVRCGACGRQETIHRFARVGDAAGNCPCGAALLAGPVGMCSVMPAVDLSAYQDIPLAMLGLEADDAVGVFNGEGWTYFFFPTVETDDTDNGREWGEKQ